jgi:hypothetical protein
LPPLPPLLLLLLMVLELQINSLSDSLEPAMHLIHMNGMVRTGARLIKGVKLQLEDGQFHFGIFSVISWFKVRTSLPRASARALNCTCLQQEAAGHKAAQCSAPMRRHDAQHACWTKCQPHSSVRSASQKRESLP